MTTRVATQFNPNRWVAKAISITIVLLARIVKKLDSSLWKMTLRKMDEGGTRGLAPTLVLSPESFKTNTPESLAHKGSSVDTQSYSLVRSDRPIWALEIEPFLSNHLSAHTRRAYESDLKQFFSFLKAYCPPSEIHRLRSEHIILFRKQLEEGRISGIPMAQASINRKLAVLKSFFQWLVANDVLDKSPAQHVKGYPQGQDSLLKALSDDEARRILDLPKTHQRSGALHHSILHCLLYLGLRKGELTGLKIGDISVERGVDVLKVRGKGHKVRILPLIPIVKRTIEHYLRLCGRNLEAKEEPLFTPTKNPRTKNTMKRLNPNAITYIVQRYAKKAGVMIHISPHSCRATCISNALDRRATHRAVQHLAGWSTPLMIQRYDKRREDLKNSAAFTVNYGVEKSHEQEPNSK